LIITYYLQLLKCVVYPNIELSSIKYSGNLLDNFPFLL